MDALKAILDGVLGQFVCDDGGIFRGQCPQLPKYMARKCGLNWTGATGDGRNCDIISFNSSGKEDRSFSVDDKIIDLSTHKGRVALLTNDDVMLYSKDGKHYSTKSLRSDPHTVVLYTGSDAYVLCTGYIDTISL